MKYFFLALTFSSALLISCKKETSVSPQGKLMEAINSASVSFAYSSDEMQNFLRSPKQAYTSGYFYFEDGLAEDVIFGLDIEWIEGTENPIHIAGGDWMSLAGIQRNGLLFFPIGAPENLEGIPTDTEKWEVRDLGVRLESDKWYKMTITADFGKREFISFHLEGENIDILEDISGFPLEYPNYIPIDKPALTFYTFALRGKEFAPNNEGGARVYFDDIEGGVWQNNQFKTVFSDGFENQNAIEELPIMLPVSPLVDFREEFWYFENDDSKIKIVSEKSRTGSKSILCDADLRK